MTALEAPDWTEQARERLAAALDDLRVSLIRGAGDGCVPPHERKAISSSPLESIAKKFALSAFERDLLLLCAGVELDAEFARLCRQLAGGDPTFGFALTALSEAHWSAITPSGPLRYWRLIEVRPNEPLMSSPLRVDERILHHLAGASHLEERLQGLVRPYLQTGELAVAQCRTAEKIARLWANAARLSAPWPAVQIVGEDQAAAAAIASAACAAQGIGLCVMQAADLPPGVADRTSFERLWARDAALGELGLLIAASETDSPETLRAVAAFAGWARSAVIITAREPLRADAAPIARFDVEKPPRAEQAAIWRRSLAQVSAANEDAADRELSPLPALDREIGQLVNQFDFGPAAIAAVSALVIAEGEASSHEILGDRLWDCCRAQARGRLDDLAQRVVTSAGWRDLVLPADQMDVLQEIVANVRHRNLVYDGWGFAADSARGLGVGALFAGASGTGKTLAAEIMAHELRLDLYRIDLSQVVNKYIGETEKNLRRVFDAAEAAGAVLLFDEADALFGKRSDVKDSHDRYANMEVSYLLQRMESYRGLAILTTNLQQALDPAFRRRLRFVVQFPFPEEAERAEIWRRIFPPSTPTENLDPAHLARLNVAGGNIRNIALGAAFLAAEDRSSVTMAHVLRSTRAEYAKLGRPLTAAEVGEWTRDA
jgi:hypothetical protein